jgi:large subunit ribosomal protein L1
MAKDQSKRYTQAQKVADPAKRYGVQEAVALLQQMPAARFDETIELAFHLGVDPKQSDQMVRGTVNLPHGSGKKVRVLVFTETPEAALAAGADAAGLEDLLLRIEGGWLDFDVAVATSSAMKEVRRVARILGPRGLMPNPRSGTVVESEKVAQAIADVKAGRVEFKMDKTANMAVVVGKRSFDAEKLVANIQAALAAVKQCRPSGFRGSGYVASAALCATMSPSLRLEGALYAAF